MSIPIKMKGFLNVEISIYSRAGFFIYLLKDFSQRFTTKQMKEYLHKINEKSQAEIHGYFNIKNPFILMGMDNYCSFSWHFH